MKGTMTAGARVRVCSLITLVALMAALGAAAVAASLVLATGPSCPGGSDEWTGGATVDSPSSGDWGTAANWTGGVPDSTVDACLPAGSYTVTLYKQLDSAKTLTTLSGSTLSISGNSGGGNNDGSLTLASGGSNDGTIDLTDVSASNYSAHLVISSGTLTNTGTIETLPGASGGGGREIAGNVSSSGTVTIDQSATFDTSGSTFNTSGTMTIASSEELDVQGGESFTLSGGTLTNNGNFNEVGGTFTHSAGTANGTHPLGVEDVTLSVDPSSGSAGIFVYDNNNTLSSDVASGETLTIAGVQKSGNVDGYLNSSASRTSAGTIILTNTSASNYGAHLVFSSGTLTNTGTIETLPGTSGGGTREISGNVSSSGTVTINQSAVADGSGTFNTSGTLTIAANEELAVQDGESFTLSGGTLTNNGGFNEAGGTFTHSGGTATGYQLGVEDVALSVNPSSGSASIFVYDNNNSLTSNVASGETLTIAGVQKPGNVEGDLTSSASRTNAGTIQLTNTSPSNYGAHLIFSSGTLTNTGTIETLPGTSGGGGREISGNLANSGTLTISQDATFDGSSATLTQSAGATTLDANLNLGGSAGTFTVNGGTVKGTGSLTGTLANSGGTVAPGDSPGVLTVAGNYTQGGGGTLAVEIGGASVGSQYDQLAVTGTATLGGTLAISTINSFAPANGDTFNVLTYASRSGTFSAVTGTSLGGGKQYGPSYGSTTTSLVVSAASSLQPDAQVAQGKGTFVGDNIYNLTGTNQSKSGSAKAGKSLTFKVKIQNDGTSSDAFKVLGSGSNATGFTVTYKKGRKNITSQVVAGTYQTASLAKGTSITIKVIIKVASSAPKSSSVNRLVTLTSVGDSSRQDAVKVTVTRI